MDVYEKAQETVYLVCEKIDCYVKNEYPYVNWLLQIAEAASMMANAALALRGNRYTPLQDRKQPDKNVELKLAAVLGDEELKSIGEAIADIVRQHNLQDSPEVCKWLFAYILDIIDGWYWAAKIPKNESER